MHWVTHEAVEAGRWSLLIAVVGLVFVLPIVLWAVAVVVYLARGAGALLTSRTAPRQAATTELKFPTVPIIGIIRGAIIGTDKRLSTSKTVAVLWTYSVASALLSIVIAKWLGHGHAYGEQVKNGLQGEYALLIGGPIGAAILSKGIVSNQVAGGASKPQADAAQPADLVTGDTGQTDLGDLQYILFNTVALVFFFGEFLSKPYAGLPTIPDVLLGLTSVSAVGYVAKKALPAGGLTITKLDPTSAKAGDVLTLYVSGLAGAQGTVPATDEVTINLGTTEVDAQSISTTAEGPIVKLAVPAGLAKGSCDVTITYKGQKTTLKGALTIT